MTMGVLSLNLKTLWVLLIGERWILLLVIVMGMSPGFVEIFDPWAIGEGDITEGSTV